MLYLRGHSRCTWRPNGIAGNAFVPLPGSALRAPRSWVGVPMMTHLADDWTVCDVQALPASCIAVADCKRSPCIYKISYWNEKSAMDDGMLQLVCIFVKISKQIC